MSYFVFYCHILYFIVSKLYVTCSGSSVGEERANLSANVKLYFGGFFSETFPLPLGAWDGLRYFIFGTLSAIYIVLFLYIYDSCAFQIRIVIVVYIQAVHLVYHGA